MTEREKERRERNRGECVSVHTYVHVYQPRTGSSTLLSSMACLPQEDQKSKKTALTKRKGSRENQLDQQEQKEPAAQEQADEEGQREEDDRPPRTEPKRPQIGRAHV